MPADIVEDDRYIYNFTIGSIYSKSKGKELVYLDHNGYNRPYINGGKQLVHRVLYEKYYGKIPTGKQIDHINGNKLDNRIDNLRMVSCSQNNQNKKKREGTTSKYKNVSFHKRDKKWEVRFYINGQKKCFGGFSTEEEAATKAREVRNQLVEEGLHIESIFE